MIELCARVGYQDVSVAQVSSQAGVSSATFYEQFDGKEDCLLAAFSAARERVFRQLGRATTDETWPGAARETLEAYLQGYRPIRRPGACCSSSRSPAAPSCARARAGPVPQEKRVTGLPREQAAEV